MTLTMCGIVEDSGKASVGRRSRPTRAKARGRELEIRTQAMRMDAFRLGHPNRRHVLRSRALNSWRSASRRSNGLVLAIALVQPPNESLFGTVDDVPFS